MLSKEQFGHLSANEILSTVELAPGKENLDKLSEEAYASGTGGDIKRNWVKQPLTIWHEGDRSRLADGHHRLAVAKGLDPDRPIPVRHQHRDQVMQRHDRYIN